MPGDLIALTHDDIVELVIEEAAEVILAAQKVKRFGFDRIHPGHEHNGVALFRELGDLAASIEAILSRYPVARHATLHDAFDNAMRTKISRALAAKAELMAEQRERR